jgi:hypothetical protein
MGDSRVPSATGAASSLPLSNDPPTTRERLIGGQARLPPTLDGAHELILPVIAPYDGGEKRLRQ